MAVLPDAGPDASGSVPWPETAASDTGKCRCGCLRLTHRHHHGGTYCGLCRDCARFSPRLRERIRVAWAVLRG